MQDRVREEVFASKCQYQAQRARDWWGVSVTCGEGDYDVWGGVHEVVEVVGAQNCEIARRGRFWPAKPKTESTHSVSV